MTLMTLGPVTFEVYPFNATGYTHSHASDFANKPIIGAREALEWVGEGAETWTIKAKIFPFKFGGMGDLEKLRQARQSGQPQYMMRGDGSLMGWVVIESVTETSSYLSAVGVGKVVEIDIRVRRSERPSNGSFFSVMQGVFSWLT